MGTKRIYRKYHVVRKDLLVGSKAYSQAALEIRNAIVHGIDHMQDGDTITIVVPDSIEANDDVKHVATRTWHAYMQQRFRERAESEGGFVRAGKFIPAPKVAPGSALIWAANLLGSKSALRRLLEEAIADMQADAVRAHDRGDHKLAKWIVFRDHVSIGVAVLKYVGLWALIGNAIVKWLTGGK